jgi:hypothetical protein
VEGTLKPFVKAIALFVCSVAVPAALANTASFTLAPGQAGESWSNSATNSGILTLSLGNIGTITLTGYSCPQTLCASTPTQQENQLTNGLTDNAGALGVATNSSGAQSQIPRSDFVTVDFSNVKANITSVTIKMTDVVDGWDIYSTTVKNEFDSADGSPIAQGNNGVYVTLAAYPTTSNTTITPAVNGISSGSSTFDPLTKFITVSALQADCETEISSLSVTYASPEPTTCMLMGCALLGLGLAGKKLRRKV